MKPITMLWLILSIALPMSGQTRTSIPTKNKSATSSIRSVDFRNFTYERFYSDGEMLVLRDGTDGKKIPEELSSSYFVSAKYVDLDGDGDEEAVVTIGTDYSGSAGYGEHYLVFKDNNDGNINQVFQQYRETPKALRIVGQSIIIVAPSWGKNDAHCCPRFTETSVYRWRGNGLMRISRKLTRTS